MSLMETIAQIGSLQRSINDQISLIDDFLRSNRDSIQLVQSALSGSSRGWDRQMLMSLERAETGLKNSRSGLVQASAALDVVQMI